MKHEFIEPKISVISLRISDIITGSLEGTEASWPSSWDDVGPVS